MAKKPELKVKRACVVSLPAKHLVVKQMEDGTIRYEGNNTAFGAQSMARGLDLDAFHAEADDLVTFGASTVFEDHEKQTKTKK